MNGAGVPDLAALRAWLERGLELTAAVEAAGADLQAHLTGTPIVAGELEPPPAPAPAPAPAAAPRYSTRDRGEQRRRVLAAFDVLGPGWVRAGDVTAETGMDGGPVRRIVRELQAEGRVEHNGNRGPLSRIRWVPDDEPPAEEPEPELEPPAPDPEPATQPAPRPAPPVSGRTRRALDAEQRLAERPNVPTLDARILMLLDGPDLEAVSVRVLHRRLLATSPDLAGVSRDRVQAQIDDLVAHGLVRPAGRESAGGDPIYRRRPAA